jgi:cell pole-organizing protein PopZ
MTHPAKGHEPSMEEILASIRRIIADEPSNSSRNEATRNETARERSWRQESLRSESLRSESLRRENPRQESPLRESPRSEGLRLDAPPTVIPRSDDARRDLARDIPSSEGLPHTSPIGSMELREEACLPRSEARTQPALSAVTEETTESSPPGPSRHEGLSGPQPATAQEEIDQIMAMLHTPRPVSAVVDEDADDILEFSEQQRAAAEALPAAEFAAPDGHSQALYEEEQEEEGEERAQQGEQQEQAVAAQAAAAQVAEVEVEPARQPEPMPMAKAAIREPYRPTYEHVRLPVREQPAVPAPEPVRNSDRHRERGAAEQGLVSAATSAAVDSAFNTLAQTVLVQNGRTLEDLVREMLRPLLKTWLDDNLPSLVERLVRAEIDRVSRGRG